MPGGMYAEGSYRRVVTAVVWGLVCALLWCDLSKGGLGRVGGFGESVEY